MCSEGVDGYIFGAYDWDIIQHGLSNTMPLTLANSRNRVYSHVIMCVSPARI